MIRSALSVRFGSLMIPGSLRSFGIGDPETAAPNRKRKWKPVLLVVFVGIFALVVQSPLGLEVKSF